MNYDNNIVELHKIHNLCRATLFSPTPPNRISFPLRHFLVSGVNSQQSLNNVGNTLLY